MLGLVLLNKGTQVCPPPASWDPPSLHCSPRNPTAKKPGSFHLLSCLIRTWDSRGMSSPIGALSTLFLAAPMAKGKKEASTQGPQLLHEHCNASDSRDLSGEHQGWSRALSPSPA